jgi:UDP-glucose 4-epimerase
MKVLVTGGASFIGSHLVEKLVEMGREVIVVDNFSTGRIENLSNLPVMIYNMDLTDYEIALKMTKDVDIVYHLAAVHGGREFIHFHEADTGDDFVINHNVLKACAKNGVKKIIFTSSACVYEESLQSQESYRPLKETDIDFSKPLKADKLYGWSKLLFEMELDVFSRTYGIDYAIARFFTAYGPRENNTHAIMALLNRAIHKNDPYVIWGDGTQGRDFIFVDDLVRGLISLEGVSKEAVNFGYGKIITINEAVEAIFELTGFRPEKIEYDKSKPTGPHSRVADISKAKSLLDWEPKVSLKEGLRKSYEWMIKNE